MAEAVHEEPKAPSLADQYDLRSIIDPTEVASASGPAAEGAETPPPAIQRDPETGRFVKPEAPKHSPSLLKQAKDLGVSEEDIAEMSGPELRAEVRVLREERLHQLRSEGHQARQDRPEPTPEPEDVIPADTFDPSLEAILRRIVAENKEMKAQLAEVRSVQQTNIARTFTERCDQAFAKHKDWLGDGTADDFDPDSPEMTRRQLVANYVREKLKTSKGTFESKIDKAVAAIRGGTSKPTAEPTKTPEQDEFEKDWREGALNRPTQRANSPEPNGRAKAIKAAEAFLKDRKSEDSPTTLDEFPD